MIRYPRRAVRSLAFLFRGFNDIEVYVEDTNCHNLYEVLINRMLDGRAKVQRVFQVGGRQEVINACESDQGRSPRRRLYIIDGDFNAFFEKPPPELEHLYQLKVYCSENLVFSPKATYEVAYECLSNVPRDALEQKIGLVPFLDDLLIKLVVLFRACCVAHRLAMGIGTAALNATLLIVDTGRSVEISETKISQRVSEIERALADHTSTDDVRAANEEVNERLMRHRENVVKFIPGKTMLLPLLYHHLHRRANYQGTLDQLKVRLARHCELDIDRDLRSVVIETARA